MRMDKPYTMKMAILAHITMIILQIVGNMILINSQLILCVALAVGATEILPVILPVMLPKSQFHFQLDHPTLTLL